MGKVKAKVSAEFIDIISNNIERWRWVMQIETFYAYGSPVFSKKDAKEDWECIARRLRIPDDAWEWDNG